MEEREQTHPVVVGVAVQELEAWLVADQTGVHNVLGQTHDTLPDPEGLPPGRAKEWLDSVIATTLVDRESQYGARREIAEAATLDRIAARCPSFERFRKALRRVGGR